MSEEILIKNENAMFIQMILKNAMIFRKNFKFWHLFLAISRKSGKIDNFKREGHALTLTSSKWCISYIFILSRACWLTVDLFSKNICKRWMLIQMFPFSHLIMQ